MKLLSRQLSYLVLSPSLRGDCTCKTCACSVKSSVCGVADVRAHRGPGEKQGCCCCLISNARPPGIFLLSRVVLSQSPCLCQGTPLDSLWEITPGRVPVALVSTWPVFREYWLLNVMGHILSSPSWRGPLLQGWHVNPAP